MNRVLMPLVALFSGCWPLLMDTACKGAALLALAGVAALALRKASAATRHLVWLMAVAALLVLPLLSALLPSWRALPSWTATANPVPPPGIVKAPTTTLLQPAAPAPVPAILPVMRDASELPIEPEKALTIRHWLPVVWGTGFIVLVIRLFAAQWLLRQVARRSTAVSDERMLQTLAAARRRLDIRQPVHLLLDSRRTIPMVWGLLRTRLLLPAEALQWSDSQLRSVLLHELAHVKRRDLAVQWILQLACALHWFNPLVWFAAWRLHVESERACDNLVLAGGVPASEYAEHLLHVATNLGAAHRTPACGLAMARPSRLEGRLLAVLNGHANRQGVTRALALATLALGLVVTIPVAMLRAADGNQAKAANPPAPEQKAAPSPYSSEPAKPWAATGRVTGPDGNPLADVEIWVHAGMGTLHRTGMTNTGRDGRYMVPFGRGVWMSKDTPNLQFAQVTAHKPGFFEKNLNRHGGRAAALSAVPAANLQSYGVTAEQLFLPDQPQTIDFVMLPAARIQGRLVGTGRFPKVTPQEARRNKDPRPADEVTPLQQTPLAGWRVWLVGKELPPGSSVFASAQTDANGGFIFENVPTGYEWQFQTDTHHQGRKAEPKSAPFTLESAAEASFELEIPEDQQTVRILQRPGRRAQSPPEGRAAEIAMVEVADNGTLSLAGQPVTLDVLVGELTRRQRAHPGTKVVIQAAPTGAFANVARLLDALNRGGIESVSLTTRNSDERQASRVLLEHAERALQRVSDLHQKNLVSESEYSKAALTVAVLRAELAGDKAEVGRLKLRDAEQELKRMTELHNARLISEAELHRAQLKLQMLDAELKGYPLAVSRVRLEHAEREWQRASELYQKHLISEEEYRQAALTVETLRAEVDRLKARHGEGK